jgi:hypothetical protein
VNGQFEAAWQLHRFLTERDIPYVVIGGIAVQRWGEPRLTDRRRSRDPAARRWRGATPP